MDISLFNLTDWLFLGVAAFVIGISKTGVPGAAILATPLAAMVLPARISTGVILPMLIVGDIIAVSWYRRGAAWGHLFKLLPISMVGVFIGYRLLGVISDSQLRPLIGGVILVMLVLARVRRVEPDPEEKRVHWLYPLLAGIAAGIATMMANAAGPVMALYLLAMGLPKYEFIGTGAWYFFVINSFKIPFSLDLGLVSRGTLQLNSVLLPFIIAGAIVGIIVARRLPEKRFSDLVQLVTALAAIKLLF